MRAYQTASTLFDVLAAVTQAARQSIDPELVEAGKQVAEKAGGYRVYNILPLDVGSDTSAPILKLPEVRLPLCTGKASGTALASSICCEAVAVDLFPGVGCNTDSVDCKFSGACRWWQLLRDFVAQKACATRTRWSHPWTLAWTALRFPPLPTCSCPARTRHP